MARWRSVRVKVPFLRLAAVPGPSCHLLGAASRLCSQCHSPAPSARVNHAANQGRVPGCSARWWRAGSCSEAALAPALWWKHDAPGPGSLPAAISGPGPAVGHVLGPASGRAWGSVLCVRRRLLHSGKAPGVLVDGGDDDLPSGCLGANWRLLPATAFLFTPDHLQKVLGAG